MQDVPARRGPGGALADTHRAGAEAAAELIARSASAHTRRVYASALGQLASWLDGRRLDDASLAAYLGHLHQAGRAPAPSRRRDRSPARLSRASAARRPPTPPPDVVRPAASPPRSAPPCSPPAGGRAAPAGASSATETAERRGLVDAAIVALLFHGALRRSEVAALRRADVDLADGGDVVVTVRRSKTNQSGDHPDVRRLVGSLRGRHPPPAGGDRTGTRRFRRRSRRRPSEPPVCGCLRRGRPRGPENVARRSRGTRRRAHRPAGPPPTPSGSPAAGRTPAWWSVTPPPSPPATVPSAATCDEKRRAARASDRRRASICQAPRRHR